MITLVLGGDRSGKSRLAEDLACKVVTNASHRYYLACGVACDGEMAKRIALHKERRMDKFVTVEEPYNLAEVLRNLPVEAQIVLIDCLTTWLGNLFYKHGAESELEEVKKFLQVLREIDKEIIIVSSELGLGLVPAERYSRLFRDKQGSLNQAVAELADEVFFVIAGQALPIKSLARGLA